MPVLDGIEATRRLAGPDVADPVRVLVLTTFDLDDYVYEALRAGASGFLLKDATRDELLHAVRVVAAGDALLAPSVTRRLIAEFVQRPPAQRPDAARLDALTQREREVLRAHRPRHVERRDRRRADRRRRHGEVPCRPRADEARTSATASKP